MDVVITGEVNHIYLVREVDTYTCATIVPIQTDARHGAAWGHFNFVGRVRLWDGLCVLLRKPVSSELDYLRDKRCGIHLPHKKTP